MEPRGDGVVCEEIQGSGRKLENYDSAGIHWTLGTCYEKKEGKGGFGVIVVTLYCGLDYI